MQTYIVFNRYVSALNNGGVVEGERTSRLTKNLLRSITRNCPDVTVQDVDGRWVLYAKSLSITDVVKLYVESQAHTVKNIAKTIRDEIKNIDYRMPWPPRADDLKVSTFNAPPLITAFMRNILNEHEDEVTVRTERLSLSFTQDLVFAIHKGKLLTPKSVLFPMYIKSICNSTTLLTATNRLGHGVSYSKLLEVTTEVAYENIDSDVVPDGCPRRFTIIADDNIGRLEETLSGTLNFLFMTYSPVGNEWWWVLSFLRFFS